MRVHDLLRLLSADAIENLDSAPAWVQTSLERTPFVVVRRAHIEADRIAVGVRGSNRTERWGSFVSLGSANGIIEQLSPADLRSPRIKDTRRLVEIPAFLELQSLEQSEKLADKLLQIANAADAESTPNWGPGGAVGFELASRCATVTRSSDLDLILRFDHSIGKASAAAIQDLIIQLAPSADVLVETPYCGFSLSEYCNAAKDAPILLRCNEGPRLGSDPWAHPIHCAPTEHEPRLRTSSSR